MFWKLQVIGFFLIMKDSRTMEAPTFCTLSTPKRLRTVNYETFEDGLSFSTLNV